MRSVFVGIDVGTSGVKAIGVDPDGRIVGSATERFDFDRPMPGWAETPPSRWWNATCIALQRLMDELGPTTRIASAGLSGQMHGSVFLSENDLAHAGRAPIAALAPALMWNDQRTEPERASIESLVGGKRRGVELTGCPSLCGLTAPKILWLREHRPETYARLARFCMPKDYIALCLTGTLATDVGDASGTMLLDPRSRNWNPFVLGTLGIERNLLPDVIESGTIVGRVTPWAASESGLPVGTPVTIGSGDNQAAAAGAGVVDPGEVLIIMGTSGVVLAPSATASADLGDPPGRLNLFCDATGNASKPGRWILGGCMLSAAGSLEWARDTIAPGVPFAELVSQAESAPPGSAGLVFLPYLTGERCPFPDASARGGWIGLTRSHTRAHLVRSVLEGVAFGLAQIVNIARDVSGGPSRIRVTGGGARSALWRQILADALGTPVVPLATTEGSALGAAALAAAASGDFGDIRDVVSRWIHLDETVHPKRCAQLVQAQSVYDRLYHDLKAASAGLGMIDHCTHDSKESH